MNGSPQDVVRELRRRLPGETLGDILSRGIYATDASIYQMAPLAVVTPRSATDVAEVLAVARQFGAPVLARGGGTSLAGQAVNAAIVLDFTKHMNRILEVNAAERWVRVEPGLVRDELNATLKATGLEFAPETSTSNRAAIGGMIGNNSSGMRSIRYGKTIDHVLEATVMLSTGEVATFGREAAAPPELLASFRAIMQESWPAIESRFPRVMRRVGGYALDEFKPGTEWNLAKLLCGSEGTLGILLSAKLALVEPPRHVGLMAVHFADLAEALRTAPAINCHDPLSVELMDGMLISLSRGNPTTAPLCGFIEGSPEAILAVEVSGDSPADVARRLDALEADLRGRRAGHAFPRLVTPAAMRDAVELRKHGLGVMTAMTGDAKPISFIEDACVPVEHLADYIMQVRDICEKRGYRTIMYGHASVGVLHFKPILDLKDARDIAAMEEISREAMQLVRKFGGAWSGEHGDGIARGAFNAEFFGPELIAVFRRVKALFDPEGLLNPRRLFDTPRMNENLRFGDKYRALPPKTYFGFREAGGFAGAVEMCNGVGACRKTLGGTMCPSYMVTRDEEDTTRGRANALRLAISGQLGPGGFESTRLHEALELCLECKACKTECPSNVDMAKMKSEFLAHYHKHHPPTGRDRAFAFSPKWARRLSGWPAAIVNGASGSAIGRMAARRLGVAPERDLPKLAGESFAKWFRRRGTRAPASAAPVAIFADTFTNFHEPRVGQWAVRLLEALGYRPQVVDAGCCGRTLISKGFLHEARELLEATLVRLDQVASHGTPIVVLEPSCASSIIDDAPDLVRRSDVAHRVAKAVQPIELFLDRELEAGRARLHPKRHPSRVLVHGHCHQKALWGTEAMKRLLRAAAPGADLSEVDSGCCGMAGSFGYEAEHYGISVRIAERRLLPAVRTTSRDTLLVANGTSCRHQISDLADREAMHFVEAMGRCLTGRWHG